MSSPNEAARRGGPDDRHEVEGLQREARASVAEVRGGPMHRDLDRSWALCQAETRRALGDDPDAVVILGTLDDVPLGYGLLARVSAQDGTVIAVLREIFVVPEAREVGVGEAIMAEAFNWAMAQGCSAIDAVALPGDRATKNFFETHLMSARLLVMHRKLSR